MSEDDQSNVRLPTSWQVLLAVAALPMGIGLLIDN